MTEIHTTAALHSSERVIAGTTVVALSGEIDLLTARPLSGRLDILTAVPCPDLVLDLRSVSFLDCSGLSVLCRARTRTADRGGRLRIVTRSTRFLQILRLVQLCGVFEIHAQLPNALAAKPESGDTSATAG
ncbi:STAS domain-containing protein [Streptomyces sp. NPDC096013]|uniref:STAS domain-containing protein n=1 Tax=Streptomyces sp. NPDC096013 TaxID=3366069 RepID=UPI00380C4D1E